MLLPDFYDVRKLVDHKFAHVQHVPSIVCDKTYEALRPILSHDLQYNVCSTNKPLDGADGRKMA